MARGLRAGRPYRGLRRSYMVCIALLVRLEMERWPMNICFRENSRRFVQPDRLDQKPGNRNCLGFFGGNTDKCSLMAASARFSHSIASTSMSRSAFSAARRRITRASTSAATDDVPGL